MPAAKLPPATAYATKKVALNFTDYSKVLTQLLWNFI